MTTFPPRGCFSIRGALMVLALLGGATGVRGDMAPGPFDWSRDYDPQLRFENLADYPDFDFYLKYGRSRGNPSSRHHLTRVTSGATVRLEGSGRRITSIFLIAVPRGQEPPLLRSKERSWLTDNPPGVLQSEALDDDSSGATISSENDGYILRYTVSIKTGKLEVARLPSELVLGEWLRGRLPYLMMGLVLCLIVAGVGIWGLRRLRREKSRAEDIPLGPTPTGPG